MNLTNIFMTHIGMNYLAFLGGIQISAVINLYITLYHTDLSIFALLYLIVGGLFIFLGGYFSMVLVWNISEIIKEGEKTTGTIFNKEDKMSEKLSEIVSIFKRDLKIITKMRMCFYLDVVLTGIGLTLIFLSKILTI